MERWDICGTNEALKKAGAKATTMCKGLSGSPTHDALLADLSRNVQDHVDRPGGPVLS